MIETSPDGVKHRFVTNGTAHHCNTYEIWPTSEGSVHPSTVHRLTRIAVLEPAVSSVATILEVRRSFDIILVHFSRHLSAP